jgi:transcriptional regulator with XRE-family HTH domain
MGQFRDEILLKKIAVRLQQLRNEKSLTQEDVYNDTNIHIGRIEQGKLNVSVSTLKQLCDYYKIGLIDFFKGID